MFSSTISEYTQIRKALKPLLEGVVISIDPSCGSTGSMPGWSIAIAGRVVASGTIELDHTQDLFYRLQALQWELRKLYNKYSPDVLVYESIAPRRYGGGSAHGHASLLKSVGVVLSMVGPTQAVGLRPPQWKREVSSTYVKGDEADSVEMLKIAIENARWILENDKPRKYGGEVSKTRKSPRTSTGKKVTKKSKTATRATKGDLNGYKATTTPKPRTDSKSNKESRKKPARKRG